MENRCQRCDRVLSDPNAVFGWRCAEILGVSGQLSKMGADINVSGRSASIRGVKKLDGINAEACDLRSGAALMAAMIAAYGDSKLYNIHYIDRGYENFSENLISLGAKMERIE